jgi:hypothetical protein
VYRTRKTAQEKLLLRGFRSHHHPRCTGSGLGTHDTLRTLETELWTTKFTPRSHRRRAPEGSKDSGSMTTTPVVRPADELQTTTHIA